MDQYIGLDVDSKKVAVCILEGERETYKTLVGSDVVGLVRAFLVERRRAGGRVHVTFEISGEAGHLYDAWRGLVDEVHVANPAQAAWIYRTSKKNDRIDARKLAVLTKMRELPAVHMPARQVRQWRQLILHRAKLVHGQTQVKNRVRALVRGQGHRRPGYRGSWWSRPNRAWLRSLATADGGREELWMLQLEDLLEDLAKKESQVARVTQVLDGILARDAGARLVLSVPGVGPRTAEALLAYTDDVRRFGNYKQYCAYFGMTPRLDESGSTRRLGHISKQGPAVARWLLCESAWRAVRHSPALRAYFARVTHGQRGRRKIAAVAVARKVLCIVRALLLNGEMYDEAVVLRTLRETAAA